MTLQRFGQLALWLALLCGFVTAGCGSSSTSSGTDTTVVTADTQPSIDLVAPQPDTSAPQDTTLTPDLTSPQPDQSGNEDSSSPSPLAGVVVINEIHYSPKAVDHTAGEYFELVNRGDQPVALKGWIIAGAFGNSFDVKTTVTLPAKGYLVFAKSNDPSVNGGIPTDSGAPIYYFGSSFSLPDSGGEITLRDNNGKLVQTLTYGVGGTWPNEKSGVAIELKSPDLDGNNGANWTYAVNRFGLGDLGTPGLLNGYGPAPYTLDPNDLGWQDPIQRTSLLFSYFDDVESVILSSLDQATTSVHMAMFNLRRDAIIDKLAALKGKGIDVLLLVDKKTAEGEQHNIEKFAEVVGKLGNAVAKVPMQDPNDDSTMHNKFTVIDGKRVLTGSMNYSTNALLYSDEDFVLIDDSEIAAIYETEFQELSKRASQNDFTQTATVQANGKMRVLFSPDDNPEAEILNKIATASSSIYLVMFSLNRKAIATALVDAHKRGVKVVAIVDAVQAENVPNECACGAQDSCTVDHGKCQDEVLEQAGIAVFRFKNERSQLGLVEVHNKIAVIDGVTVLAGSTNWTNLALLQNDENLVSISSALLGTQVLREVTALLQFYLPNQSATSLGFSDGPRDVTITVRGATVDAGSKLYLVGDHSSVGSDNYALAKALTADGNNWQTTLSLPAGTTLTFHIFVKNSNGHNFPEQQLRRLTVPFHDDPTVWSIAFDKQL